jgi:asparagine synthase (glutamine-hydrolysing)
MSVQFGKWNFDGKPVEPDYIQRASGILAPYAPDGINICNRDSIFFLYGAFHTTDESQCAVQPHLSSTGVATLWDGRLDNRANLIRQLLGDLTMKSADVQIVAAAYQRWGADSFAKFIGDWALSVWNPNDRSLVLAKDVVGTRHLYYSVGTSQVTWGTLLDPLVLLANCSFSLEQEYVAAWIASSPAAHLTPYAGIHSVPAATFVKVQLGRVSVRKYWDFDGRKRIRYRTDQEYDEHFRIVFGESVRRRLRSDRPVLAELSGGMDSSSVVCMADAILASGAKPTPRLDTVSYYNDSEPNWNERPYFEAVEQKRGQSGWHIAVDSTNVVLGLYDQNHFCATPGTTHRPTQTWQQFRACVASNDNRVLLSGIAGDELLGGVPNPVPELADYLRQGRLRRFLSQSIAWALAQRKPLLHLAGNTLAAFSPLPLFWTPPNGKPPVWLYPRFLDRYRAALRDYDKRLAVFGPLPSFQTNLITIDALRRQIATTPLPEQPLHERRYPYLDRDLLEFLFAIPREQLLRPHQRRSLMRRALRGIVPEELLNRRRKAFVARSLIVSLSKAGGSLADATEDMVTGALRIVNAKVFREMLDKARQGHEVQIVSLTRTLQVEWWLRHAAYWGVLNIPSRTLDLKPKSASPKEVSTCAGI